ncbi:MAG: hypothetical protein RQ715_06020 [Methylococcales bacterium]|nr:hypothetical protein [Methylococcales bacterium]
MTLLYVCLGQLMLCGYCFKQKNYQRLLPMGLFLLLLIGALEFYGQVNQIPIDPSLNLLLVFTGLSHLALGGFSTWRSQPNRFTP